ncbi:MAG: imidazoleglycerol-phosphate dehydratase HisB [Oscillospiraceae bacterium]
MRATEINRKTKETDIKLAINLDGTGKAEITTGIGFFDHMLTALAVHSGMDIHLEVKGDLEVDCHHTIEDTGIVLGMALGELLSDKSAIQRYGTFYVPMDEALAFTSMDISGRAFLVFNAQFKNQSVGQMDCCMTEEFFRAVAVNAGITLHINLLYGSNDHHSIEAIFKACAHALKIAMAPHSGGVLSTKGVL